jgi:predicted RNA-binding protein with PIN domain
MKFFLDAYNIIGELHDIQLGDSRNVTQFVHWLERNRCQNDHFTAVFDGQIDVGFPRSEKRPGLTIVHTPGNQTADTYIKNALSKKTDTSAITVVTSDRDILNFAKKIRVKTWSSRLFIQYINAAPSTDMSRKQSPPITTAHVAFWLKEFGGQ